MSLKPNARSKAIVNVLNSTGKTVNEGISSASDVIKDSLSSMRKSLTGALESNSSSKKDNPIFDEVVPSKKGGKRKSKKRKSKKHRKTAKK